MSLTQTFRASLFASMRYAPFLRCLLAGVLLLVLLAPSASASDKEEERGNGFFQYFPAPPDIKLPKLDIIPFWTSNLKKARKAYNKGDYARALRLFRRESEDGNVVADWYLAHMYRLGQGVERDHAVAYSYYERVAGSYDPDEEDKNRLRIMVDSQIHMANYMRRGIPQAGLKADAGKAARTFLRISTTYGHPAAQFAYGVMTMNGEGVKKNPQQGLKWVTSACRKRNPEAQAYMGDLYWEGTYVKKSETRALMWYTLAIETARPEEHAAIINRYEEIRAQVDEETRLEAEARARVWAEQFPREGD